MQAETLGKGRGWLERSRRSARSGGCSSPKRRPGWRYSSFSDASAPMTGLAIDLEQSVTGAPV
jgi:hypothetical protein